MGHSLQSSEDDISVYAYSLEIIFIGVCQIVGYLMVAACLGFFTPTFLVMLSHTGLRFFGGGYHLKTFSRCLIWSGLFIAGLVWVSMLSWPEWAGWSASAFTGLAAVLAIHEWVPAGTEKKPLTDPAARKKQKKKTLAFALILLAVVIILQLNGYSQPAQALITGAVGSLFCISPWGYAFWGSLDHALDHLRKEG